MQAIVAVTRAAAWIDERNVCHAGREGKIPMFTEDTSLRALRHCLLWVLGLATLSALGCGSEVECVNPVPQEGGIEVCDGGFSHRPQAEQCSEALPVVSPNSCLDDVHCPAGEYCLCGPEGGGCIPTGCRTDADCEAPHLCASLDVSGGPLQCQTDDDECLVDDDCRERERCIALGDIRICYDPADCDDECAEF